MYTFLELLIMYSLSLEVFSMFRQDWVILGLMGIGFFSPLDWGNRLEAKYFPMFSGIKAYCLVPFRERKLVVVSDSS